jgi:glycosyltransferase involved in cell wall biosynthesis
MKPDGFTNGSRLEPCWTQKTKGSAINILHLIDHYRIGGPGKTIINCFKFTDNSKFSIHVATFVPSKNGGTEFTTALRRNGIPFLSLQDSRGIAITSVMALKKYIQKNQIRILHSHGYKTDILALIIKKILPGLVVVTTHHGWIANTLRQDMVVRLDLFLTRCFDGILVVSKSLLDSIPRSVKNKKPCVLIHNAIVLNDYRPQNRRERIRTKLFIDKDELVLGVVGRLSPEKGCVEMLKAFTMIYAERPKTKLLFIGEGPLAGLLKRKAEILKVADRVIFRGHCNPVNPFYEALDVLVCPSITEGLSNVILEALAYRLPVIATDVGGNGEIIRNGFNGYLVKPHDIEALKVACLKLIDDPCLAALFGKRGKEILINKFDFQQRTRKEERFYITVIEQRSDFIARMKEGLQNYRNRSLKK